MIKLFIAAILCLTFTISTEAQTRTRTEKLLNEFQEQALKFNKKRTYENFLKYLVKKNDKETRTYLRRKHDKGEMRGELSKVEVKNKIIHVGKNRIEIININKMEYKLNGYKLNFRRNMKMADRFAYIERVLKSQQSSSVLSLIPKAYADGSDIVPTVGIFGYSMADDRIQGVNNGLASINQRVKGGYGVKKFSCTRTPRNSVQIDLRSADKQTDITYNIIDLQGGINLIQDETPYKKATTPTQLQSGASKFTRSNKKDNFLRQLMTAERFVSVGGVTQLHAESAGSELIKPYYCLDICRHSYSNKLNSTRCGYAWDSAGYNVFDKSKLGNVPPYRCFDSPSPKGCLCGNSITRESLKEKLPFYLAEDDKYVDSVMKSFEKVKSKATELSASENTADRKTMESSAADCLEDNDSCCEDMAAHFQGQKTWEPTKGTRGYYKSAK